MREIAMTEESPAQVQAAQRALALARHVGAPAAAAARRTVRRHLFAMGVASALAVLGGGLIDRWEHAGWPRSLAMGALWAVLFGAAAALVNARAVRAVPARAKAILLALISALVVGAAMAVGPDYG